MTAMAPISSISISRITRQQNQFNNYLVPESGGAAFQTIIWFQFNNCLGFGEYYTTLDPLILKTITSAKFCFPTHNLN
ncbi:unnamed protein product [Arabidopsis halleri]